jgi:hypothetical protein
MTPTNIRSKEQDSHVTISKSAVKLQNILEDKGYSCKILTQGQCSRHIVDGKAFLPPEFPVQVEFTLTEPSDQEVVDSLLVAVLEHINHVHNCNVSGNILVTLRDPEIFELIQTKGWTAHLYLSVLCV